jgi:hypothetical protein
VKFRQGASVKVLAAYIAEMLGGTRGEGDKAVFDEGAAVNGSAIPMASEDPTDLLERLDEMSDEEVDRRLSVLAPQGHG